MRLTKKLMKKNHTELWLWLAKNPKKEKDDWPRWKINGGDIFYLERNECFPCEYTLTHRRQGEDVFGCRCPLDFPRWEETDGGYEYCLGGLFDKWRFAKGKARSAIAKQIAELPIRKRR